MISLSLSPLRIQSDGDDNDEDIRTDTPSLNRSSTKNKGLRRRQTIGGTQPRRYTSHHRTPFKQLQAKFRPSKQSPSAVHHDLEQMPMMDGKQMKTVQRSASVREKHLVVPTNV